MSTDDAIKAAATAVRAHQTAPDTVTLRDMQDKVQQAQNQGVSLQDIANANQA
ncbi:hypothetical protein ACWD4O_39075 [Streptomyces sp. NPDC002623]